MDLSEFFSLCGAMSPLGKLVLASDLNIAAAYFAIPISLLVVRRHRLDDLPYPWLFLMFAGFIVTCGLTHLVHAYQMPFTTFEHTLTEAWVKATCAFLSVVTAGALIWIMPTALRMISPLERAAQLERIVEERTKEKEALAREINHRLGNFLQIVRSAVRMEQRQIDQASNPSLSRIAGVVDELGRRYHQDTAAWISKHALEAGALTESSGTDTLTDTAELGAQKS
jgi:hypothetical protein